MALPADDPVFDRWQQLAAGRVLVAGFAELGADGRIYNSAILFDGSAAGRCTARPTCGTRRSCSSRPGDEPPPVVDTAVGRIALMICYDFEFPEMTRSVACAAPTAARADQLAMGRAPGGLAGRRGGDRDGGGAGEPDGRSPAVTGAAPNAASAGTRAPHHRRGRLAARRTADEAGSPGPTWTWRPVARQGISDRNDLHGDRRPELY